MSHILLVEDNLSACYAISSLLDREGFTVQTDRSGLVAMAQIGDQTPDLMIIDLSLPDIDGLEVCTYARGLAAPPPVIIISGVVNDEVRAAATLAGAAAVFQKPFDIEPFLETIRSLLGIKLDEPNAVEDLAQASTFRRRLEEPEAQAALATLEAATGFVRLLLVRTGGGHVLLLGHAPSEQLVRNLVRLASSAEAISSGLKAGGVSRIRVDTGTGYLAVAKLGLEHVVLVEFHGPPRVTEQDALIDALQRSLAD